MSFVQIRVLHAQPEVARTNLSLFVVGVLPEEELVVGEAAPAPVPGAETADVLEDGEEAALLHQTVRVRRDLHVEAAADGRRQRHLLQRPLLAVQRGRADARMSDQTETRTTHCVRTSRARDGRRRHETALLNRQRKHRQQRSNCRNQSETLSPLYGSVCFTSLNLMTIT